MYARKEKPMTQESLEARREKVWSRLKELSKRGRKFVQQIKDGEFSTRLGIVVNGSVGWESCITRRSSEYCCGLSEIGGWGGLDSRDVEVYGYIVPEVEFTNNSVITTLAPSQQHIADTLLKCGWTQLQYFLNNNSGNMVRVLGFIRDGRAALVSPYGVRHPTDVPCDRSLYEYRQ
jgi:hypothetical protein